MKYYQIDKWFRSHLPNRKQYHDPAELIGIGSFDLERTLEMDPEFLDTDSGTNTTSVTSTSAKFAGELNINKIEAWIGDLMREKAEDLFRTREYCCEGYDQKFVFQGVHMLFGETLVMISLERRRGEECRFVFIGRNLDHDALGRTDGLQG